MLTLAINTLIQYASHIYDLLLFVNVMIPIAYEMSLLRSGNLT